MAGRADLFEADDERFDMRALWRVVAWGSSAAVAIALAVLAGVSQPGTQRLAVAFGHGTAPETRLAARSPEAEAETRRLTETVRALSADRDRMLTRIAGLEKSLDDVTGSIAKAAGSASAASASSAVPAAAAQAPGAEPPDLTDPESLPKISAPPATSAPTPADPAAPAPQQPAQDAAAPAWSMATALPLDLPTQSHGHGGQWSGAEANAGQEPAGGHGEFGIDIGGGASVEALRTLWTGAHASNGALLERLRPLVGIREVKPGYVELRLIAGPLADAAAAAKLCTALTAHGHACRAVPFDGQRLALH